MNEERGNEDNIGNRNQRRDGLEGEEKVEEMEGEHDENVELEQGRII